MAYEPTELWCVFDPNWAEGAIPLVTTIGHSRAEAINRAIITDERGAQLYSGASTHTIPPRPGSWEQMASYGYRVREVKIELTFWSEVDEAIDFNMHTEALIAVVKEYDVGGNLLDALRDVQRRTQACGYVSPSIHQDREAARQRIRRFMERNHPEVFEQRKNLI